MDRLALIEGLCKIASRVSPDHREALLSGLFDELDKIAIAASAVKSLHKFVPGLRAPSRLMRPTALARKVRIAKDAPARVIAGNQPRMISKRSLRPTMEVPMVRPAVGRVA